MARHLFGRVLAILATVFVHTTMGDQAKLSARQATACPTQPIGQGPVPTPDTAEAFDTLPELSILASSASVPTGYTQTFSDLNASCSNVGLGSVGYTLLTTYDTLACTSKCDETSGCVAANIYFERAPTVQIDPSIGCDNLNPPSTTLIKCAFWSHPINASVATDKGESQYDFQVTIRGSNGYVKAAALPTSVDLNGALSTAASTSTTVSRAGSTNAAVLTTLSAITSSSSTATPASTNVPNSMSPKPAVNSALTMALSALTIFCGTWLVKT